MEGTLDRGLFDGDQDIFRRGKKIHLECPGGPFKVNGISVGTLGGYPSGWTRVNHHVLFHFIHRTKITSILQIEAIR